MFFYIIYIFIISIFIFSIGRDKAGDIRNPKRKFTNTDFPLEKITKVKTRVMYSYEER